MLTSTVTSLRPARSSIARIDGELLRRGSVEPVGKLLAGASAVVYRGALTRGECDALVDRVYEARAGWRESFGGAGFTLGIAHAEAAEQGREAAYFDAAADSDALVERELPGLRARVYDLFGAALGGWVEPRRGWAGPGVHVFPPLGDVARRGAEPHYDLDGLTQDHVDARAPAFTCILMLQPADFGGGLRVWAQRARGEERVRAPDPGVASEIVHFVQGDLVVVASDRLHQIMPFGGAADRVSAAAHAVWTGRKWEVWL